MWHPQLSDGRRSSDRIAGRESAPSRIPCTRQRNQADGDTLDDERVVVEGVPTVVTALAIQDQSMVVGTIDGRLLVYTIDGA